MYARSYLTLILTAALAVLTGCGSDAAKETPPPLTSVV